MRGKWMEAEIREQGSVLATVADGYRNGAAPLEGKPFDLILLAARGSSDNAALYARYLFEVHLGIPVSLAAPSVLTRFGTKVKYPRTLAIGVSQSGQAPDVAEVLSALRQDGHSTLAITNTEGSRLTREAEHTILLGVGKEQSVAATKTFTASCLALYQVARGLGAPLPEPQLPSAEWIDHVFGQAEEHSGTIVRSNPVFALGRGYEFSSAVESALKLMECALIPAKSYSSADFEHGPKALAGHGSAAIVFDGDKPHLRAQGCELVACPTSSEREQVAPEIAPLWDVIFGQALALLAARARGLDPDAPRHLAKVTETL